MTLPAAPQTFTPLPSPSPEEAARFCLLNEILVERIRQISGKGYQAATDDTYVEGELAQAAAAYALSAAEISGAHAFWPWHMHTYRPGLPRRDLIKGAALILAEIERLDRAQPVSVCTCMEVFGEDPDCKLHGRDTDWAKANPENGI